MDLQKTVLKYFQIIFSYILFIGKLPFRAISLGISVVILQPLQFIYSKISAQYQSVVKIYTQYSAGEPITIPEEQRTVSSYIVGHILTSVRTISYNISQVKNWVIINGYLAVTLSVKYLTSLKSIIITFITNIPKYIRALYAKRKKIGKYKDLVKNKIIAIGLKIVGLLTIIVDYITFTTNISFTIIYNIYTTVKQIVDSLRETDDVSGKLQKRFDDVSKKLSYTLLKLALTLKGKSYRDPLFESEETNFPQIQMWIEQANRDETAEDYMSRVLVFGLGASISAVIFGSVIGSILATQYSDVSLGLSTTLIPLSVYNFVTANIVIIGAVVGAILLAVIALLLTFTLAYIYMYNEARQAKRRIDIYFNEGVSHIYTLAEGGATTDVIIEKMVNTEETTGGVAIEFQKIQDIIQYEREDITSALQIQAGRTPSEKFANLLNDLQTIQESGTSPTQILRSKHNDVLNNKRAEAKNLQELIDLLSEVVVILGVAPVFITIIFLVIAIQGEPPLTQMYVTTYAAPIVLLILSGGFALLINQDESKSDKTIDLQPYFEESHAHISKVPTAIKSEIKSAPRNNQNVTDPKTDSVLNTLHTRDYVRQKILDRVFNFVRNPFAVLPYTVIGVVFYFSVLLSRQGIPSTDIVLSEPISFYGYYLIAPLLILFIPVIYLHDKKLRKVNQIESKIPVILDTALNSIKSGDTFAESLQRTRFSNEGVLRDKNTEIIKALERSWNNIQWKRDRLFALKKMANELEVSSMTKTMKVITDSAEFTPDLVDVISIERENVQVEQEIQTTEKTSKRMAIAIVFVVVGLVAGILLILDISFIGSLEGVQTGGGGAGGEFGFDPAVFDTFSALFQHLAVNMAFAYGTFAGLLKNGSIITGLKYGLGTATFTFVVYTVALLIA